MDALDLITILANLFEIIASLLLVIFGIKPMRPNFLEGLKIEKTLIYLLIFGLAHSFSGVFDVFIYRPWIFRCLEDIMCFLRE
jgi:hypothetical protein